MRDRPSEPRDELARLLHEHHIPDVDKTIDRWVALYNSAAGAEQFARKMRLYTPELRERMRRALHETKKLRRALDRLKSHPWVFSPAPSPLDTFDEVILLDHEARPWVERNAIEAQVAKISPLGRWGDVHVALNDDVVGGQAGTAKIFEALDYLDSCLVKRLARPRRRATVYKRAWWHLAWDVAITLDAHNVTVTKYRGGVLERVLFAAFRTATGAEPPDDIFHVLKPVVDQVRARTTKKPTRP